MNLAEAHDYIDLLLDKADQPYFTDEEKTKFLNLAISDFINFHYQKMLIDEDSRRALAPFVDWKEFSLTASEIFNGTYIYANRYPGLSEKFTQSDVSNSGAASLLSRGYFRFGNQYVFPTNHLYTLAVQIRVLNNAKDLLQSDGTPYPGVTVNDISANISDSINVKNVSVRDHYENANSKDPFNKTADGNSYSWSYVENRLAITSGGRITSVVLQSIQLPTVETAFSEKGPDTANLTDDIGVISEHYQKQIIESAVDKMTRVDVGLMTGPS